MITTHNTSLRPRILDDLNERGIQTSPRIETVVYNTTNYAENFLNNLFSYPYLDMAFFMYENEIIFVEEQGEVWGIFGLCDAGYFCIKDDGQIALLTDECEFEIIAISIDNYVTTFIELVQLSTMNYINSLFPDRRKLFTPDEIKQATGTLQSNAEKCSFWGSVIASLQEGDATPRRHLLTYLKDGAISQII